MTPEQKAAFINAQTALLNCEVAGMIAENQARQRNGYALAYTEEAFDFIYKKYEPVLGYNAIIQCFRD